jgi:hypothetical protein
MLMRDVYQRVGGGVGGGTLGPLHATARKLDVTGLVISQSEAGDEYGMRWLTSVAQGQCSGLCVPYDVQVRTFCPDEGDSDSLNDGLWTMHRCGVTAGPTWTTTVQFANCYVREFKMTLQSELPYLYSVPDQVVAPTSVYIGDTCSDFNTWICGGGSVSLTLTAPFIGDICPIIEIYAGTPNATGEFFVELDGDILYWITNLPANSTFTIDTSTETFVLTGADGTSIDGTAFLELSTGTQVVWPVVNCAQTHTISATGVQCGVNDNTTIAINTVMRQL